MSLIEYTKWQKIALDTNTIINLVNGIQGYGGADEAFTVRLINDLSQPARKAEFYVGSVVLSELHSRVSDASQIQIVMNALRGQNVVFTSFDPSAAQYMATHYGEYIDNKRLNGKAHAMNWQGNDLVQAREWINRDLMVLAEAQTAQVDVILTQDIKTMFPMAKEVGAPVAMTYSQCYHTSPSYIFEYRKEEADSLYQIKKPGPKQRGTGFAVMADPSAEGEQLEEK